MYLKGYKVTYPVKGIWDTSTQHRYFLDESKAKEFHKIIESQSNFLHQLILVTEVAFIVIEGKHYCLGGNIVVEDAKI